LDSIGTRGSVVPFRDPRDAVAVHFPRAQLDFVMSAW
jgi:hypothetical protein